MRIIVFVNEKGTEEGDCDFKEIELCEEDEQSLFVMVGHSLSKGNKLEKIEVLSEKEYQELLAYKYSHPRYIKYKEAQDYIKEHNKKFHIDSSIEINCDKRKGD